MRYRRDQGIRDPYARGSEQAAACDGRTWGTKTYDISAVVERGETQAFVLMTDGFWEYVYEEEMLATYKEASSAQAWLDAMGKYVLKRADMTKTDNYSAIVVRVEE